MATQRGVQTTDLAPRGALLRGYCLMFVLGVLLANQTGAEGQTPPKDVEGWRQAKWGMTEQQLEALFKGEVVRPKEENRLVIENYEIEGAKQCAIELNTFSKEAGFTGVRLGWTVVPKGMAVDARNPRSLNELWFRRVATFFNGASNVAQAGGLAALTPEGRKQNRKVIAYYMRNAALIRQGLQDVGLTAYGGTNAPYVWAKTPGGMSSWDFFDKLLNEAQVVATPGSGFGSLGEGYIRFSAFGHRANIEEAVQSVRENLRL